MGGIICPPPDGVILKPPPVRVLIEGAYVVQSIQSVRKSSSSVACNVRLKIVFNYFSLIP